MKRLVAVAIVLSLSGLAGVARAEDKKDASGTWKWEVERQGQKREVTLKLKVEGDKLTGTMPGRQNTETKIEDGTYKDGTVSFKVTRERDGNKVVIKYTGKVEGDTLKLKVEPEGGQARDIEAKRAKD